MECWLHPRNQRLCSPLRLFEPIHSLRLVPTPFDLQNFPRRISRFTTSSEPATRLRSTLECR